MWSVPQPQPPAPPKLTVEQRRWRFVKDIIMAGARSGAIFDDEPADVVKWAVKLFDEVEKL